MKVLVTGAGGFVGRVLTKMLSENGHAVTGMDLGHIVEGAVSWVQISPNETLDVSRLPQNQNAIIHLAQSPAYRQGATGEAHVFQTNVAMYADLLRYAAETKIENFVSASTGTVYEPFTGSMKEDAAVSPTGFYGASKLAAEVIANSYRDRFNVCHIRPFFVYGPHQKDMLIARLIDNIRSKNPVNLPENGPGLRFVPTYVDDVARCFVESIENGWSGPVNVASPEVVSFEEILNTIASQLGVELNLERKGPGPDNAIVPDLTKLESLTDVTKFRSLNLEFPKQLTLEIYFK